MAEVLNEAPGGAMHAGQFANQRGQARSVTGGMLTWRICLDQLATTHTVSLVQQEVADLHVDGRQLDHLMGVVRRRGSKLTMTTHAGYRIDVLHLGGLK